MTNVAPLLSVVGALPPPMHGAAEVTQRMSAYVCARGPVQNLDTAPRGRPGSAAYHLSRLARVGWAVLRVLAGSRVTPVYISAAGGFGAFYDLSIVLAARLRWRELFLHHHSFAYVDRWDWRRAFLFWVAGRRATHVCLCPRMANSLRTQYRPALRTLVVSNTAFFAPNAVREHREALPGSLVIGHLSNLSREKGLDLVIETFAQCGDTTARLVLAGAPTDDQAADMLMLAKKRFGTRLDTRGLVAGAEKARFYAEIDIFLFPTRYANEAEPLVIIEALAAGVPVIAYKRGCIGHMIPSGAGEAVALESDFVAVATGSIAAFNADPNTLIAARYKAQEAVAMAHRAARRDLDALMRRMGGAGPAPN